MDSVCCFGKQQCAISRELSSDNAVLLYLSTTEWLFSRMPVKTCCVITKNIVHNERANVADWKGIIRGRK
jgi:hypothetical protein